MLTCENTWGLVQGPWKGDPMANVKIKLTRPTVVAGVDRDKGWCGQVNEKDAAYLMRIGKAVPAGEQAKDERDEA